MRKRYLSAVRHQPRPQPIKIFVKTEILFDNIILFGNTSWIPLLRFRSALHCGYSSITDIQDGLFFVLTRARTFKKS
jgi:hypothetical protein